MIGNVTESSTTAAVVEVLTVVFAVRPVTRRLETLVWQRARDPEAGRWSLPGGTLLPDETVDASARRQLAAKVDLTRVAHLEQIGVFSDPDRRPGSRTVATGFLGLVPADADPDIPADTAWHAVDDLPAMAFDHAEITHRALQRLRGKLSYTNLAFALAPPEFTLAGLRDIYTAVLGHEVDATNLHRILTRRGMLTPTGTTAPPGPQGGRPAALHRFTVTEYRVTDPFAALRPPD